MKTIRAIITIFCLVVLLHNASFGQWYQVSAGFDTCSVNCLLPANNGIFAGTGGSGVFFSQNGEGAWSACNTGLSNLNIKALAGDTSGNLYAGTKSLVMYTSADTGATWTAHSMVGTGTSVSSIMSCGAYLLVGQVGDGVFRSVDQGATWMEMALCCASVLSLGADDQGWAWAGTNAGKIYRASTPFSSWTEMDNGLPAFPVKSLCSLDSLMFAGTYGGGVAVSSDDGANWDAVNNGLSDINILTLTSSGGKLFAGTDGSGVWLSIDRGQQWMAANDGLGDLHILCLAADSAWLYAGTLNHGLWKRPLDELSGIISRETQPQLRVYPVPAHDRLHIVLPPNTNGTVQVLNLMGQPVIEALTVSGERILDLRSLPSALYLLRLQSAEGVQCTYFVVE